MEIPMSALLVATRRDAGLSQRALARRSGIPQATISRIESGNLQAGLDLFERLITACDATLELTVRPLDGRQSAHDASLGARDAVDEGDLTGAIACGMRLRDGLLTASARRMTDLVADEPLLTGSPRVDAMLAAVAEEACSKTGAPVPRWVDRPERFLPKPTTLWPVIPSLRYFAVDLTPPIFARHRIVVDARDLDSTPEDGVAALTRQWGAP